MASPLHETSFWILTALAHGHRHGYAILGEIEALSGGAASLRVTTLYAALERLQETGLIQPAGQEVVDGRARRYYALAPEGRAALEAEVERMRVRTSAARAALRGSTATRLATA
ncbi:MAG: PadR family transcriptional regulator [Actinomycetota bacterium]